MSTPKPDPSRWVDLFGDALFRYALLRVHDPELAADLVQETFLAALSARDRFAGRSAEKTWLIGILKHKVGDHFRRSQRVESVADIDPTPDLEDLCFDERGHWMHGPGAWKDPDASLQQREFWDILFNCIGDLPARLADLFIFREFDELSNEEICELLDISSTNNMWVMLSRTRLRLRHCLEMRWFGPKDGGQ